MVEVKGAHEVVNIQLNDIPDTTEELKLTCDDGEGVELCHFLHSKDISLRSLSLTHVNLVPDATPSNEVPKVPRNNKRRLSSFNSRSHVPDEEQQRLKDEQELELYKTVFARWGGLSYLEIQDGSGVLNEPVHFIKSLSVTSPLLETLKIKKTMHHESSNDDNLNLLDNATMSSLSKLDNLRVLHLLGFAGRQNRYKRYLFTDLDNAVQSLAQKGKLEEFHFSQSGVTFKGVFSLIRHCKNLRDLKVWSRFGEPGLFMLHHNLPFLRLADHHKNSAVYEPLEDSPRQVVLTLVNILLEQSRYDPAWVNDTYPEDKITVQELMELDGEEQ